MAPLADLLVTALAQGWEHRGWIVVAAFVAGLLAEQVDREWARWITVGAWASLAIYGASMVSYFFFEQKSIVETLGSLAIVPLSIAIGYHLWRGRDSLFVLSRTVAIAGLIYQPVTALEILRQPLIETVSHQTAWLLDLVGSDPELIAGETFADGEPIPEKDHPYESTFLYQGDGYRIAYTIVLACTGIGSIAVFGGLILAVSAPVGRKLKAMAVSIPVIYGLNLVRNVFIAIGFGEQRFQVAPEFIIWAFGLESHRMVSYIVADRIIAQSASVVALVGITWLVIRQLPEVLLAVEEALYVVSGYELDLFDALGIDEDASSESQDRVQPGPSD